MKKIYIYGKIIEQTYKYAICSNELDDSWKIGKEYNGKSYKHLSQIEIRFEKLRCNQIFYEYELNNVKFLVGQKIKVKDEILLIEDIVYELDGSIEYYTDKIIDIINI